MTLSNTLVTLIERAERKGQATKRVRELAIMGAGWSGMTAEDVKRSPMVDQWRVTITRTEKDRYENIIVDHYGTEIAHIVLDHVEGTRRLHNWYGEGNADRDALNGLMSYYGLPHSFRYRPSLDKFEMIGEDE